jgi:HAD superfamily hydrolase (TIGR01450 family)
LQNSDSRLTELYDCAMLDLDGVVYRGTDVIAGAAEVLDEARQAGLTLAFVTNNAARPPQAVADQLNRLGVTADVNDVVTSAQAAARELAKRLSSGAPVLVVGGEGLVAALTERGLRPVWSRSDEPAAVVQGFHPDVGWRQLAEAAYAIAGGVPWVASNLDLTVPTADGIAPGNGSLVNAVAAAVGHGPDVVAGKPHRPLFDETVLRVGAQRPVVVGDRLDTDVEGANRCSTDALLVMTGVTDLAALCAARPPQRPSYVSWTLDGLLAVHESPQREGATHRLGGWSARVRDGALLLEGSGTDTNEGLRAAVAAAWAWYDDGVDPTSATEVSLDIEDALRALRLPGPGR